MSLAGMAQLRGRPSLTPNGDLHSDDYEVSSTISAVFAPLVLFSNVGMTSRFDSSFVYTGKLRELQTGDKHWVLPIFTPMIHTIVHPFRQAILVQNPSGPASLPGLIHQDQSGIGNGVI